MIQHLKQILFCGFLLLILQAQGSEPYRPQLANPVLESWRRTDFPEFDTIRISCLAKGKEGGMWMGIGNKAVFYDGYKSIEFIPDSATIHSLVFEKDNNLLAATSKGIFRYKEGEFRKILNFRFNSQRNFITDSNGAVWIGSDFGILRITTQSVFCLNQEGYFEIAANGSVINTLKLETGNDYHLNSVTEIKFPVYNLTINEQQELWMTIGQQDKNLGTIKLNELNGTSVKWKFLKIPGIGTGSVSGICEANNSVYVTSSDINIMLARYVVKADKWESINMKAIGGDNVQSSILKTPDGTLWIGGHSKLYALKNSGWKVYQYPDVVLPLSYIELTQDQEENLFAFGNDGSLLKIDLSAKIFCTWLGLNFQCNSADGKYWFTTNTGKVVECDQNMQEFTRHSSSDGLMDMAMTMHFSANSGLWAAGSHNGKAAIARFRNGKWENMLFPELYLGIAYNGICELGDSALAFPVNGLLELGNTRYHGGFVSYNFKRSAWKAFTREKVPQRIPSMGQTSDGRLWFSGGDFNVYDGNTSQKVDLQVKATSWTDDVRISSTDRIWVAQGGTGLFYNDGKRWTRYTTFNGLASNMVTNIYIENDSAVYIASDKGISFYDGKQFIRQIIHPELNIQRVRFQIDY